MDDIEQKNFQIEVLTRLAVIESKLDGYAETKTRADEAYVKTKDHEKRISRIEDNNKWLWRTVVGAVLVAVIEVIFIFIQFGARIK